MNEVKEQFHVTAHFEAIKEDFRAAQAEAEYASRHWFKRETEIIDLRSRLVVLSVYRWLDKKAEQFVNWFVSRGYPNLGGYSNLNSLMIYNIEDRIERLKRRRRA